MPLDADIVLLSNQALARFAAGAISIDDETPLASTCDRITSQIVDARLTHQAWSFATFTYELVRDDAATWKAGYRYAFRQIGGRLLGPIRVAPKIAPFARVRLFAVENDFLFCDEPAVFASYIMRPPMSQWPPLFREALILIVAEALALAVSQKLDLAQQFHMLAFGTPSMNGKGGAWGQWIKASAMQGSLAKQPFGEAAPLIAARMGGAR